MSLALSLTQDAPSCSEHELVAAVRQGSDRAFEVLYSRYRDRIGSYVFGMVGDHQRAEDIAQEVFIAALRRLRATERPIAFKPWIYEIAKNACIDEFRRTRRAREVPLGAEEHDAPPQRLIAHGADAAIENKQRLDDLRGAFRGLSDSHHRMIVMRELEGRSYSHIAETLGMSKPVVESTLFRARRRLGEEYDELASGRRCERVQGVIAAEGEHPLRSLGIRERKLLARHLSHCQPCRRQARMAGLDESFFHTPSLAAKLAALFPLPWVRWRRGNGNGNDNAGGRGGQAAASGGTHSLTTLQSLQKAAPMVDPTGPAAGLGRAAATAAAIVIAGAGGGLVSGLHHGDQMPVPRVSHALPAGAPGSASAPGSKRGASRSTANAGLGWVAAPGRAGGRVTKRGFARGSATGGGSSGRPGARGAHGGASAAPSGVPASSQSASSGGASGGKLPLVGSGNRSGAAGALASALPKPKLPNASIPKLPKLPVSVPTLPSNPVNAVPKPQLPNPSLPKLPPLPLPVPGPSTPLPPLGSQGNGH